MCWVCGSLYGRLNFPAARVPTAPAKSATAETVVALDGEAREQTVAPMDKTETWREPEIGHLAHLVAVKLDETEAGLSERLNAQAGLEAIAEGAGGALPENTLARFRDSLARIEAGFEATIAREEAGFGVDNAPHWSVLAPCGKGRRVVTLYCSYNTPLDSGSALSLEAFCRGPSESPDPFPHPHGGVIPFKRYLNVHWVARFSCSKSDLDALLGGSELATADGFGRYPESTPPLVSLASRDAADKKKRLLGVLNDEEAQWRATEHLKRTMGAREVLLRAYHSGWSVWLEFQADAGVLSHPETGEALRPHRKARKEGFGSATHEVRVELSRSWAVAFASGVDLEGMESEIAEGVADALRREGKSVFAVEAKRSGTAEWRVRVAWSGDEHAAICVEGCDFSPRMRVIELDGLKQERSCVDLEVSHHWVRETMGLPGPGPKSIVEQGS